MLRNIAVVLRGSLIAQAIGFLILPILSRLFAPEAFGAYQVFQSILAALLVLASMRFEVALLQAEAGEELRAVLRLCFIVNITVSTLVAMIVGLIGATDRPDLANSVPFSLWVFPVALLIGGTGQFLTYVVTRQGAFSVSANSKVAQGGTYAATGLAIGALSPVNSGIILADIGGRVALTGMLLGWTRWRLPDLLRPVSPQQVRRAASKYREFPLISVPGGLVNTVGAVLTPIMIYATFSAYVSGQFGLVDRALGLPLTLVLTAVSQVYMAEFATKVRDDPPAAATQFRLVARNMALLGAVPAIVLFVFGPFVFETVFGAEWALAGEFARIMAPAYWLALIAGSVNMTIMLLGRQKLQMGWEIGRLLLMLVVWTAIPLLTLSALAAVILHSAAICVTSIAFLAIAYKSLKEAPHDVPEPTVNRGGGELEL